MSERLLTTAPPWRSIQNIPGPITIEVLLGRQSNLQNALKDLHTFQNLDPSFPDTEEAIARVAKRLRSQTARLDAGNAGTSARAGEEVVKMQQVGGVFVVPVRFNEVITLNAIVDSGASDVSVPADLVLTLVWANTITGADFLGEQT